MTYTSVASGTTLSTFTQTVITDNNARDASSSPLKRECVFCST